MNVRSNHQVSLNILYDRAEIGFNFDLSGLSFPIHISSSGQMISFNVYKQIQPTFHVTNDISTVRTNNKKRNGLQLMIALFTVGFLTDIKLLSARVTTVYFKIFKRHSRSVLHSPTKFFLHKNLGIDHTQNLYLFVARKKIGNMRRVQLACILHMKLILGYVV